MENKKRGKKKGERKRKGRRRERKRKKKEEHAIQRIVGGCQEEEVPARSWLTCVFSADLSVCACVCVWCV